MVEEEILTRGGVYLARLDPAKGAEVGKIRPIVHPRLAQLTQQEMKIILHRLFRLVGV